MEMFRTIRAQPTSLSSVKIVAEDETAASDEYFSGITILAGATYTIPVSITIYAGSYTNEGTLVNNGTLVIDTSYDTAVTVTAGYEVFKSPKPRTFVEVYPT